MSDEMFFSKDEKSLIRGKRIAARTETCRPCTLTTIGPESETLKGVIMDMNPFGMLIRTLDAIPLGTDISIQMMRDDEFSKSLSTPREALVVRRERLSDGFTDLGVRIVNKQIQKASERPIEIERKKPRPRFKPTRMHTLDITIGGTPRGGRGR